MDVSDKFPKPQNIREVYNNFTSDLGRSDRCTFPDGNHSITASLDPLQSGNLTVENSTKLAPMIARGAIDRFFMSFDGPNLHGMMRLVGYLDRRGLVVETDYVHVWVPETACIPNLLLKYQPENERHGKNPYTLGTICQVACPANIWNLEYKPLDDKAFQEMRTALSSSIPPEINLEATVIKGLVTPQDEYPGLFEDFGFLVSADGE